MMTATPSSPIAPPALPTLYQHYTSGGISAGLSANQSYFTLNNRNITIYSGSMHYFRVPKHYWRDRLRKMRAAGLNTVETYIPWNLHEPEKGIFDFGAGSSDFKDFLDVQTFLKTAQEEDLLAIVRPGPYICAEWEFGGFPSWLLREENIKMRTVDTSYMKYVKKYLDVILTLLAVLQFTRGGPIIAFQVENEYGSTYRKNSFIPQKSYMRQLDLIFRKNGIGELLVTSDGATFAGDRGTVPELFLQTANFGGGPKKEFDRLLELQPGKPVMAMEFWSGWFDHWGEVHHKTDTDKFRQTLQDILSYPASVNFYMFTGGTSFGFMNGANLNNDKFDNSGLLPDTTSYDYDAPLTENGDYTVKYVIIKELLQNYTVVRTRLPITPSELPRKQYRAIKVDAVQTLEGLLEAAPLRFHSNQTVWMEQLPMNGDSGQSYGYIVYRKTLDIAANSVLKIGGHIRDTVVVLLNGKRVNPTLVKASDLDGFGYWRLKNSTINLGPLDQPKADLILMVENWGRVNYGAVENMHQFKGLSQNVFLNDTPIFDWTIYPLEFRRRWTEKLEWKEKAQGSVTQPALFKATFSIDDEVMDTFIDMQKWVKGIVIVNGFVLGRYCRIGPQQTLYLPAPFLHEGNNTILVFDHFESYDVISFSNKHIFKTVA